MLEQRDGGCHCGRVRFRAQVDLDLLSQCSCSVRTKKGILHLPVALKNFELLRGKSALTVYTFGTGVAQHTFCSPSLKPTRFFDGRHWEVRRLRIFGQRDKLKANRSKGA
jgi:hypothetical protein